MSEAIVSFRRSVSQHQRYLTDEHTGIKNQVEEAKGELGKVESNISAQQTRIDEIISQFQKQFSESEEKRRSTFADSEKDMETRFREGRETRSAEFEEFLEEQQTLSTNHLDEITTHRERAEELINVIANTGMVGGYQEIANSERRTAIVWQVLAVVAFIGLIVFSVYAFATTLGGTLSWQTFGARSFVALTFGVFGAYAARQANKHEEVERRSRSLELAIASVDPYLIGLPDEMQHEVKKDLAMRFFGRDPAEKVTDDVEETTGTSADLLRSALDTINNLSGRQS